MIDIFKHPVFCKAVADIESLGLRVSQKPLPGAQSYAIVGGRSNARWWLIPLKNGRVAAGGFALFQPLMASARAMKFGVCLLSQVGLSRLWVRQKIYISGESALGCYFSGLEQPAYAYFTGTDSPHRKLAVQIMDQKGRIKGFVKLTRNSQVTPLLMHEATTLERLQEADLQRAHIPQVLFAGKLGESTLLVTDTLKTAGTRTTTRFTKEHRAFFQELASKTTEPSQPASEVAAKFAIRIEALRPNLNQAWRQRLDMALTALAAHDDLQLPMGFSHGDFTPWNTFLVKGRLYVFDWEYAQESTPPSNDFIHFLFNEPRMRALPPRDKLVAVWGKLCEPWTGFQREVLLALMIIYLLTQILRQIERLPEELRQQSSWDGADEQTKMLSILLEKKQGLNRVF